MDYTLVKIYRFKLSVKLLDDAILPGFKGSAIRGLLGHGLKKVACVNSQGQCKPCPVKLPCPYFQVFETSGIHDGNQRDVTHPFLVNCSDANREFKKDDLLKFNIVVMESGISFFPYMVFGFIKAGDQFGIGVNRTKFKLVSVLNEQQELLNEQQEGFVEDFSYIPREIQVPNTESHRLKLTFKSPTRIKVDGKFIKELPDGKVLQKAIGNSVRSLGVHFPQINQSELNHLLSQELDINVDSGKVHWVDLKRYSNRQQRKVPLGGILGELYVSGKDLQKIIPHLKLLEEVNIGKNRVFGLGQIGVDFI